jgi:2,3-bisphosphoglycerate-dependent phosphoglycerate mutase
MCARCQVVLLRHGESTWNGANRFTGWHDVPLSSQGEQQAVEAARLLEASNVCFDVVYTSTLKRTIKTAWMVLETLDAFTLPLVHSWRLNERMYGQLTGLNKAQTLEVLGDEAFELLRRTPPPIDPESCYVRRRTDAPCAASGAAAADRARASSVSSYLLTCLLACLLTYVRTD